MSETLFGSVREQLVGEHLVGEHLVGKQAVGKQAVGRQTVGRQTVGRQTVGRQTVGKQSAANKSSWSLFCMGALCAGVMSLSGCVTFSDANKHEISLKDSSSVAGEVEFRTTHMFTEYEQHSASSKSEFKNTGKKAKVEWIRCTPPLPSPTALVVFHGEGQVYSNEDFCSSWLAQVALSNQMSILGINRPGFGLSSGENDFGGIDSMVAIDAAVSQAQLEKKLLTVWGFAEAGIVALRWAKHWTESDSDTSASRPKVERALIGNSVFDLFDVGDSIAESTLGEFVEGAMSRYGEDGLVARSISYDLANLPPKIVLYHGANNELVGQSQAQMFLDALISEEYVASFEVINNMGAEIADEQHKALLGILLKK